MMMNEPTTFRIDPIELAAGGETLAGLLFLPPGDGPHPAIVVDGPLTSVKEQVASNYGRALAERGFAVLAFDHRHFGASGGQPRQYEHPVRKAEDVRAALAYLQSRQGIAAERLAVVGVCAGAGYAAHAVAGDSRVKMFAGVAGFYHDAEQQRAWMGDKLDAQVARAREARARYESTGEAEMIPAVGKSGEVAMPLDEAFEYYGTPRGAVATYTNGFAVMSREHTLPFDAQSAAPDIRVPTIVIHSDKALAPALAKKFFGRLGGPSELAWTESTGQIDFYDDPKLIAPAADRIAAFFQTHVK